VNFSIKGKMLKGFSPGFLTNSLSQSSSSFCSSASESSDAVDGGVKMPCADESIVDTGLARLL